MERFRAIEKGNVLARDEIESLVDLIMAWILGQMEK